MTFTETERRTDIFDITGRRAIVTGASRGIGRSIALEFADRGAQVCAVARSADGLEETRRLSESSRGSVVPVATDLRSADGGPAAVVDRAVGLFGGVDILVNNAGYDNEQGIADTTGEE